MQAAREDKKSPCTPACGAQSGIQAGSKDEASGGLDAHHGYGEAPCFLEGPRHVYLGNVLNGSQDGGEQAQEVCPGLDMGGQRVDENDRANQREDEEGGGEGEDEDGFFPGGHGGVLVCGSGGGGGRGGGRGIARKEDEEEQHAGSRVSVIVMERRRRAGVHEKEAGPLDTNLHNAQ